MLIKDWSKDSGGFDLHAFSLEVPAFCSIVKEENVERMLHTLLS